METNALYSAQLDRVPWLSFWPILIVGIIGICFIGYFFASQKQKRLTGIFVLVIPGFTLIGVSSMFVVMLVTNYQQYAQEQEQRISHSLRMIDQTLIQSLMQGAYLDTSQNLEKLNVAGTLLGSAILSPEGQLLAEYPSGFYTSGKRYGEIPLYATEDKKIRWGTLLLLPDLKTFNRLQEKRLSQMITLELILGLALMIFSFCLSRLLLSRVGSVSLILEEMKRAVQEARSIEELRERLEQSLPQTIPLKETQELRELIQGLASALAHTSERIVNLEKAAELGKMASQVAHDLRSPVSALGFTVEELPERARKRAQDSLTRIDKLTSSILQKRREGQSKPAVKAEALVPLIESLLEEKHIEYQKREGLEISLQIKEAAQVAVSVIDGARFQRALSNLINNAVESLTGLRGHVRVEVESRDRFHIVSVTDDGIGMTDEQIKRLERGEDSTSFSSKPNGNGLGFSVIRSAISSWGGEIRIQSGIGSGTRVSLFIPKSEVVFVPESL